jgi:glycolate oxidase
MERIREIFSRLESICGTGNVFLYTPELSDYGKDETMEIQFPFDILVKPETSGEISMILQTCNEYKIHITIRGGGSGVCGGALSINGGLILSLEKMNKIITINEIDGYVIAEAGVVTKDLCDAVERKGLYFPVSPSSSAYSFVGGNVSTNAGSINSCKFGKTGNYVLNLEVVLPTGEVIWTGANVRKNSSGLNFTQLFVGSEGVLGIITKVVYQLLPMPDNEVIILAGFNNLEATIEALHALKKSNLKLSMAELLSPGAIHSTAAYLSEKLPLVCDDVSYHLLLGMQYDSGKEYFLELLGDIVYRHTTHELLVGETSLEKDRMMKIRNNIGAFLKSNNMTYRDIDASVPFSFLHEYIIKVEELSVKYNAALIYFGHALDGNLHVMLRQQKELTEEQIHLHDKVLKDIYQFVVACGGVISGEHGIGFFQREYMAIQYPPKNLEMMKQIKKLFDPNAIINTGNFFLED